MDEFRYPIPGAGSAPVMWIAWYFMEAGGSIRPKDDLWKVAVAAMDTEMAQDPHVTAERAQQIISKAARVWTRQLPDEYGVFAKMRAALATE